MYELVNKQSFVNSRMPANGSGGRRRGFSQAVVLAESGSGGGGEAGAGAQRLGAGPVGRGLSGRSLQGADAWPRSGGCVMAEAALDAVRRELREFPAAARGEWVHAEAAAASPRPRGSLTTRAGPWACGEPGPRVGRALTLLGRRHHGSREFVSSRNAGARSPDSLPAPLRSLFFVPPLPSPPC